MKLTTNAISILIFICIFVHTSEQHNILGIFPHPMYSHFMVFRPLMLELTRQGHNVTVISHHPVENPPPGYRTISIAGIMLPRRNRNRNLLLSSTWQAVNVAVFLGDETTDYCDILLNTTQLTERLQEQYDLVILEQFVSDCFLVIPYLLKTPFIAITSSSFMPFHFDRYGVSTNPSYVPNTLLYYSDSMNFIERMHNFVSTAIVNYIVAPINIHQNGNDVVRKHFGEDIPDLEDIARHTSIYLYNRYFPVMPPLPLPPSVIPIGGIHLESVKPLPQDIKSVLDNAKNGVVYVSFGSALKSETFPSEKLNIFTNIFSRLSHTVLWKYDGKLESNNIIPMKWLPQNDVLNHPNVIAFISHCGAGGTIEGVNAGVPIVCIPFYGDQMTNAASVEKYGAAVTVDYLQLTEGMLQSALDTVLSEKYRNKAREVAFAFKDRPMAPLQSAIFWVEYVLKHKNLDNLDYLKPASVNLNFIQYFLIDVIAVLFALLLLVLFILTKITKTLLSKMCRKNTVGKLKSN